jgi:hypothetical protein
MNAQILTAGLLLTRLSFANSALALSEIKQLEQVHKQQRAQVQHLPIPNLNGLTYHEARKKLMAAGWQPRTIPLNYRDEGTAESGNALIFIEQGYEEVIDCAGTGLGYCLFEFSDVYGNYLEVVTAGQESPEQKVYATVNNWRLYNLPHQERD